MGHDLASIKVFLTVLGLATTRLPTLAEYKKAYRNKLIHHPDKGGDEELFKGITEAAHNVFKFITENQEEQNRPDNTTDKGLLRAFEASNNVKYSQGNVVFNIESDKADIWIQCLRKKAGAPVSLENKTGVQMKVEDFKIPLVSCHTKVGYGSLSVTVWPNPSDGQAKVCVQGKMYLAFVSFVLPAVIKDVEAGIPLAVGNTAQASMECLDSEDEEETEAGSEIEIVELSKSFKRMESEVITLRNDLVERVELAISKTNSEDKLKIETKIDNLQTLLKENVEQSRALSCSIDKLSDTLQNTIKGSSGSHIDSIQLSQHDKMDTIVQSLSDLRSDIARTATKDALELQVSDLKNTLTDINQTTQVIDKNVKETSKNISDLRSDSVKEMQVMSNNSNGSLVCLEAMRTSLERLVSQQSSGSSQSNPSQTPNPSQPPNVPDPSPTTKPKKGIMFSSSIGLDIDLNRLKSEFNCDIKTFPTYYIEEHPNAQDPDAYLQCMVNQHLAGKTEYDFVVIATGSNDITSLDIEHSPPTTLFTQVQEQTKLLAEISQNITADIGIDVFVIEKTPRYDHDGTDPSALKQKLSKYANGVLSSTIGPTPKMYLVEQSGLARSSPRARSDLFKPDGLHLTQKGMKMYTSNLITALRECYGELVIPSNSGGSREQGLQGQQGQQGYDRRGDMRNQNSENHRGGQDHRGGGYRGGPPYPGDGRRRGNRGDHGYPPRPNHHRGRGGRSDYDYWDYHGSGGYSGGYRRGKRDHN